MKKILLMTGAAAVLVLLGIGIYQTDASQKGKLLSKDKVKELITTQYPGEITEITKRRDRYELKIEHEGAIYRLIVNGYDASVQELMEDKKMTADHESNEEGSSETTQEAPVERHGQAVRQETVNDEPADDEKLETIIVKKDSKTSEESKEAEEPEEPKKKEQPQDKKEHQEKPEKQSKTNQSKKQEEPKQKKSKQKQPDKKEKQQKEKQEEQEKKEQQVHAALTKEEAAEIALEEFSGEVENISLNENKDRLIYEIEVVRDEREAEIEIDAYTGEIIYIEIDD